VKIGFEYPWFLAGLAFLAIPVLLHLMNREMPRRLLFPSTRFLRRAELPPEGRRRLRDLLLLLLRLAALAAAVLAFSRPWLRRAAETGATGAAGSGLTVFLVDLSSSMAARGVKERVVELARAELARLGRGERAALVLSADRVLGSMPPGTAPDRLLAAVDAALPLPVAGNHAPGLREAGRMLVGDGPRRLVVISDLQTGDWQMCREPLPPDVELRLLNPAEKAPANVAVTAATAAPIAADRSRVIVDVRNFADVPQERTVTVRVGTDTQTAPVSLPALQVRRLSFALRTGGSARGEAELSADDYTADDVLHFWAASPPPVPVVAVVPEADGPRGQDLQAFFLTRGLASQPGVTAGFQVQTVAADAFFVTDLSAVPLVFVLGAAERFDVAAFEHLREFCTGGGSAFCTPGAFPAQMVHGLRANGLLDARLEEVVGQNRRRGESWTLGWVNPEGILGEVFAKAEQTDLFLFPVRQYLRLSLTASAAVHLKSATGDPILAEQGVGRGRVFVLALPFDTQWSDLPLTASFLPLVQEVARSAVPAGYGITRLDCGQALPEFRDVLGRTGAADPGPAPSTATPGVFAVGNHPVEVNVTRRESSPERWNPYDLTRRLVTAGAAPAARTAGPTAEMDPAKPLWPVVALLAAVLLLVEMAWTLWTDRREVRGRLPAGS